MFKQERFWSNYVPDLKDNLPSKREASRAVKGLESPHEASPLLDEILPEEVKELLTSEVSLLPNGVSRARVGVGKTEDGTRHPHDFIVDKEAERNTFYFIDPEHQMNKSKRPEKALLPFREGDLRPKVATLLAARFNNGSDVPELSVLRFRTDAIEDQHVLKMAQQFEEAKKFIDTGELPEFLSGKEKEITFRLQVGPEEMEVQSRYATPEQLELFLNGDVVVESLKGKVSSYGQILRHFVRYMQEGKFESLEAPMEPVQYKDAA